MDFDHDGFSIFIPNSNQLRKVKMGLPNLIEASFEHAGGIPNGFYDIPGNEDFQVTIFPNPTTSDVVTIGWNGNLTGPLEVNLFDTYGTLVRTYRLRDTGTTNQQTISLENLSNGVYLVSFPKSGGSAEVVRIIKM